MLADARASGALRPGQTILEPSSGNTGISLAMLGARLGPPGADRDARQHDPGARAAAAAVRRGDRPLARRRRAATARSGWPRSWRPPTRRCSCPTSTATRPTRAPTSIGPGRRSWPSAGDVDAFVAGLGTGGTLTGRRALPQARATRASASIAAEPMPGELVQGLRSLEEGFVPPVLDRLGPGRPAASSPSAMRSSASGG